MPKQVIEFKEGQGILDRTHEIQKLLQREGGEMLCVILHHPDLEDMPYCGFNDADLRYCTSCTVRYTSFILN